MDDRAYLIMQWYLVWCVGLTRAQALRVIADASSVTKANWAEKGAKEGRELFRAMHTYAESIK